MTSSRCVLILYIHFINIYFRQHNYIIKAWIKANNFFCDLYHVPNLIYIYYTIVIILGPSMWRMLFLGVVVRWLGFWLCPLWLFWFSCLLVFRWMGWGCSCPLVFCSLLLLSVLDRLRLVWFCNYEIGSFYSAFLPILPEEQHRVFVITNNTIVVRTAYHRRYHHQLFVITNNTIVVRTAYHRRYHHQIFPLKVTAKFTLEQATKAQRGSRGIAQLFL